MQLELSQQSAAQLAELARRLKDAGNKDLAKSMRKRLNEAVKPVVNDVRRAALAIPSKSGDGSLRRAIARATQVKLSTGAKSASVAIKVSGSRMPPGQQSLPAYMEGTKSPWRHPVYGHRSAWVSQASHPFFRRTVQAHTSRVQAEVRQVLADVQRAIEG